MVIAATKVGLFVGNAKDGSEGALKNTTFSKLGLLNPFLSILLVFTKRTSFIYGEALV